MKRRPSAISAEEFEELARAGVPYAGLLNFRVEDIGAGYARVRMPFRDLVIRPGGTVAGPAMMALSDIAMYGVVLSLVGRVELAVTTNLAINFLRKPGPVDVIAEGRVLKAGKRLVYGDITLYSEGQPEPVAHVTCTYSVPPEAGAQALRLVNAS